jgi:hypothetical protein
MCEFRLAICVAIAMLFAPVPTLSITLCGCACQSLDSSGLVYGSPVGFPIPVIGSMSPPCTSGNGSVTSCGNVADYPYGTPNRYDQSCGAFDFPR